MRAGWLTPSALVVGAALLTGISGARAHEILTSKAPESFQFDTKCYVVPCKPY